MGADTKQESAEWEVAGQLGKCGGGEAKSGAESRRPRKTEVIQHLHMLTLPKGPHAVRAREVPALVVHRLDVFFARGRGAQHAWATRAGKGGAGMARGGQLRVARRHQRRVQLTLLLCMHRWWNRSPGRRQMVSGGGRANIRRGGDGSGLNGEVVVAWGGGGNNSCSRGHATVGSRYYTRSGNLLHRDWGSRTDMLSQERTKAV